MIVLEKTVIPIKNVKEGIVTTLQNCEVLLNSSKKILEIQLNRSAIILYYLALEEFGKVIILRDRNRMAEAKDQLEIDISDFFWDFNKKIKASVRGFGPFVDPIQLAIDAKNNSNNISNNQSSFIELEKFLINYDSQDGKWVYDVNEFGKPFKKAFKILEKNLKNWHVIYNF